MKNRTEQIEEKRKQVRQDRFKTTRRIIDCLETLKDRKNCLHCPDYAVCRRLQDVAIL